MASPFAKTLCDKILAHGEGEKAYFDVGMPSIKVLV